MLAELEEVVEYKLAPERRSTIRDMWWKRLQVLYYSLVPQVSASESSRLHEKPPESQNKQIFFPFPISGAFLAF
jgi:hypothetical protein